FRSRVHVVRAIQAAPADVTPLPAPFDRASESLPSTLFNTHFAGWEDTRLRSEIRCRGWDRRHAPCAVETPLHFRHATRTNHPSRQNSSELRGAERHGHMDREAGAFPNYPR